MEAGVPIKFHISKLLVDDSGVSRRKGENYLSLRRRCSMEYSWRRLGVHIISMVTVRVTITDDFL